MSDFNLCENGHYYPQNLKECPYCPKSSADEPSQQGLPFGGGKGSLDRTKISQDDDDFNTPSFFGGGGSTGQSDLGRTQIYGSQDSYGGGSFSSDFQPSAPSIGRKMVGWLVSFTIDSNGADFRLYEGRNLIGSDTSCDIIVRNDAAVSGHHLTILHRMGQFKFKDELSTNGTFINDVFEEEGNLKDGDVVKMGDTIFKFRSIA